MQNVIFHQIVFFEDTTAPKQPTSPCELQAATTAAAAAAAAAAGAVAGVARKTSQTCLSGEAWNGIPDCWLEFRACDDRGLVGEDNQSNANDKGPLK